MAWSKEMNDVEDEIMKTYIGIKLIQAKPMTRGLYNAYRRWTLPANENPSDEGYLVVYPDGYESWSPKLQFDNAYIEVGDTSKFKLIG